MSDGYGEERRAAINERKDRLLQVSAMIVSGLVCVHPSLGPEEQAKKAILLANALIREIDRLG